MWRKRRTRREDGVTREDDVRGGYYRLRVRAPARIGLSADVRRREQTLSWGSPF